MSADLVRASLEDLYDDAPCGYIFTLPDGRLALVNKTFVSWTGYERAELLGTRFQDLLTVAGRIFYENQYAPLLQMQGSVKEVSLDIRCKDGSHLPVIVNSTLRTGTGGQPALIASTIFDATDRQRYEQELRAARERAEQLATIVTAANDAIVRTTPDGTIETWNPGAERLFGYGQAEILGRNLWNILPSLQRDPDRHLLLQELRAGRPVSLDGEGSHADGRQVAVSVGLMPHFGLLGELAAISAIIRDISERRALERLQQEFLAMTSHELRHPLTSIKGQAQLMRRRAAYSERAVDAIVEQTDRLGRLIDDLLLASLIEADRFEIRREPVDLLREVSQAVEQLQTEEHPIQIETTANSFLVLGDRQRLGQVFANLLSNAAKYSPAGQQISVRIQTDETTASVAVVDRGVGIPPEDIPRLFSRFYRADGATRRIQGLGLGLYITSRIVHAHDGDIEVTSEIGSGSTFTVILPRYTSASR
jgi:two-component system, OmpR family, sensor histidine kinase VicK